MLVDAGGIQGGSRGFRGVAQVKQEDGGLVHGMLGDAGSCRVDAGGCRGVAEGMQGDAGWMHGDAVG